MCSNIDDTGFPTLQLGKVETVFSEEGAIESAVHELRVLGYFVVAHAPKWIVGKG
jgi:hypothetical protein